MAKRYPIFFRSLTTGTPIMAAECATPAEAYSKARELSAQLKEVKIGDNEAQDAYDLKTFAAMHRLS